MTCSKETELMKTALLALLKPTTNKLNKLNDYKNSIWYHFRSGKAKAMIDSEITLTEKALEEAGKLISVKCGP